MTVSYEAQTGTMSVSTSVGFYRPLEVESPSSGETLLVPGSSRVLVFRSGAPTRPAKPSGLYAVAAVGDGERQALPRLSSAQEGLSASVRVVCDQYAVILYNITHGK